MCRLSQTDQLLVHLQAFSTLPHNYVLPASVKEGVPLFYLPIPASTTPTINTQLNTKYVPHPPSTQLNTKYVPHPPSTHSSTPSMYPTHHQHTAQHQVCTPPTINTQLNTKYVPHPPSTHSSTPSRVDRYRISLLWA